MRQLPKLWGDRQVQGFVTRCASDLHCEPILALPRVLPVLDEGRYTPRSCLTPWNVSPM